MSMDDNVTPSDEEIHAFIDGELDDARAAVVAAALQNNADIARRAAAFRADKIRLTQAYGAMIEEPLPQAWTAMIARHDPRRRAVTIQRVAMALAASLVLAFTGWSYMRDVTPVGDETVVAEALRAHAGTLANAHAAAADGAAQTISAALQLPLQPPDLSKMGYSLAGVEIYGETSGNKAVKLAYRDGRNRLFTLYMKASSGTPRFEMMKRGDTRICLWQDDVLSTTMLGDMSAAEMLRLASLAYSGLNAGSL